MVKQELIKDLVTQIEQLNENEQLVLNLFYTEELTLTVIGEMLGLSTSRISQIILKHYLSYENYKRNEKLF